MASKPPRNCKEQHHRIMATDTPQTPSFSHTHQPGDWHLHGLGVGHRSLALACFPGLPTPISCH